MNKLLIFMDESGTMPLEKEREVFLTAGFGVFNDYPIFLKKQGHKSWLVNQLKQYHAIPYISYLNPDDKFKELLQSRLDEINKMGKHSLIKTGNNKKYFSKDGLERRNLLWVHAMDNCIMQIILKAVAFAPVGELIIYIDQKTLKDTSLNLFEHLIHKIKDGMMYTFSKGSVAGQEFDKRILSNIRWNSNNIRLIWSDEVESLPASCGLELAHYLGFHFRKDYYSQGSHCIVNLLSAAGFYHFSGGLNELWSRDIDKRTIDNWENNTGLDFNTVK